MMRKTINNLTVIGFSVLTLILLGTAVVLFTLHYDFSIMKLYIHYAGDMEHFIEPKTFSGILKSFSPHILAMPLVFFILFHLAFSAKIYSKRTLIYSGIIGFIGTFGDIFINFLIPYSIIFAYAKFLFFALFQGALIHLIWGFFKKIF